MRQAPESGWYITMGHAGFNSPTNNGLGYVLITAGLLLVLMLGVWLIPGFGALVIQAIEAVSNR